MVDIMVMLRRIWRWFCLQFNDEAFNKLMSDYERQEHINHVE